MTKALFNWQRKNIRLSKLFEHENTLTLEFFGLYNEVILYSLTILPWKQFEEDAGEVDKTFHSRLWGTDVSGMHTDSGNLTNIFACCILRG